MPDYGSDGDDDNDDDGDHIDFYWNGAGYTQYGYWDVTFPTMTGKAYNIE
jgi:hypothetical protein